MKMNFKLMALALVAFAANAQAITLADAKKVIAERAQVAKQKGSEAYASAQAKLSNAVKAVKNNKKKSVSVILTPAVMAVLVNALNAYQSKTTNSNNLKNLSNKLKPTHITAVLKLANSLNPSNKTFGSNSSILSTDENLD